MASPTQAIRLVRISDARGDDTHGVDGQADDLLEHGNRIGWEFGPALTHLLIENDTSAFKRRMVCRTCLRPRRDRDGIQCGCPEPPAGQKREMVLRTWRPKFRRALDMLRTGQADGLMAVDLDRACRDPRDLEDLIDVVESCRPRVPVESRAGSLRLANDADVTMARVMVAVANKASRDTGRRVASSRRKRAAEGKFGGGPRRYGFEPDGITPRAGEIAEIQRMAQSVMSGVSLRQIAADLRDRGVLSTRGKQWTAEAVKGVLLRPRNAGLMVYRETPANRSSALHYTDDDLVGTAPWAPVISEDVWRAICVVLTDGNRRTSPGNTPRWLGSLIYLCGVCADGITTVTVAGGRDYKQTYRCKASTHLRRVAPPVDDFVARVIVARLGRPDAVALLPSRAANAPDVAALRTEAASLRERLDEQARLHARLLIDTRQLEAGSRELRGRMEEIEGQLQVTAVTSPLAGIAGRPDAAEIWANLGIGTRREIVKTLVTVTLLPMKNTGRLRGPQFDPLSVAIEWRRKLDGE